MSESESANSNSTIVIDPVFKLYTAPKIVIVELRSGSPEVFAGLQVGGWGHKNKWYFCYKYKLREVIALFISRVGRKITIAYERCDKLLNTSFKLKKVL